MESNPPDLVLQGLLSDRYEILGRLGMGGMAYVLHARDHNLQREVAIKVLREDLIDDPAFRDRFLQEARAAANLAHPNIVTIHDFGHDRGRYYIVMEYIEGSDLKALIRQQAPMAIEAALDLSIQICAGVGYAHRTGLVHCDLKPQNVLVTHDGRAKITDFGIARALASIQSDEHSEVVWGSPQYIAPEQSAGGPPSPSSDVYSLGIILYEMLTGVLPFDTTDPLDLARLHQTYTPPSARSHRPELPEPLEQVLAKVLSKEPSARYRTADQLGRVLGTLSDQLDILQEPPTIFPSESVIAPLAQQEVEPAPGIDWLAVILSLLAFLAVGGLIPLWLWVCFLYPTCPIKAW